jgi:hypothetical protein
MSKQFTMSKFIRLDDVKIGKATVYLDQETGNLRMGTKGAIKTPVEFCQDLPKAVRRVFRKRLYLAGYPNVAARTIAPKNRNRKIIVSREEWEETISESEACEADHIRESEEEAKRNGFASYKEMEASWCA